jgi:hypothetical protein
MGQLLLEQVRFSQAAVEGQQLLHPVALVLVQVPPAAQHQPAIATKRAAGLAALAGELGRENSARHWGVARVSRLHTAFSHIVKVFLRRTTRTYLKIAEVAS